MPLLVNDFSWTDSNTVVVLTVPLKATNKRNVDVLCTPHFFKVAFPPYYFECALLDEIVPDKCVARFADGCLFMTLHKKHSVPWLTLFSELQDDPSQLKLLRIGAHEFETARIAAKAEAAAKQKKEQKDVSVRKQINLDADERQRVDFTKEHEKQSALDSMGVSDQQDASNEFEQSEHNIQDAFAASAATNDNDSAARLTSATPDSENEVRSSLEQTSTVHTNAIFTDLDATRSHDDDADDDQLVPEETHAVRKAGRIAVKFSHRAFPTAARESQNEQEQEWLRKQADARKIVAAKDSELSEAERDPTALRKKGLSFYNQGNFESALAVFSHALRLHPANPSFFSNRAACQLQLRNYIKCAEDCSAALDLLTPPVRQNADSRKLAFIRRGTAYCHLELYVEGLRDYDAALQLDPDNAKLKEDADRIRKAITSV